MRQITSKDLENYKDIRGTLVRKRKCLGRYMFIISDKKEKVKVIVGKGLYEDYSVGDRLTVGHIGKMLINIRRGFCYGESIHPVKEDK